MLERCGAFLKNSPEINQREPSLINQKLEYR